MIPSLSLSCILTFASVLCRYKPLCPATWPVWDGITIHLLFVLYINSLGELSKGVELLMTHLSLTSTDYSLGL